MFRFIVGIILGVIMVVFAVQNTDSITLNFIVWAITVPSSLVVIVVLLVGMLLGWILTSLGRIGKRR